MSKKITVIGTGYVGLVAVVGLADFGNSLTGVDIDRAKVEKLNKGIPTIYEPGIGEYLQRNIQAGRLHFTSDIGEGIRNSEVIFIAVGTPPKDNGDVDLSQVEAVVDSISSNISSYKVIVTKSTVPIGTNKWIKETLKKKSGFHDFDIVSNPEFLREGKALHDFFHPDRIIVGFESERAREYMDDVYRPLYLIQTPFVWCNIETAELIKYASNTFLATKITFINQMANLAEAINADIHVIAKAMGMDGRISPKFLHPGPGFGGSCFPKDTKALIHIGESFGVDMSLIREVMNANERQKDLMVDKLKSLLGTLHGKTIALLGLAFKAETDDIRDSPAINIVEKLIQEEAIIKAHDPEGIDNFKRIYPRFTVNYYTNEFDAIDGADAIIICTEWNEYRNLNLEIARKRMKGNVIFDTRNVLDSDYVKEMGFVYKGLGRG
ncbi:MAG: UDP-glucose/GDP-mannose dehydrogenase family protein [Spirochaetales bacterium]|nr:UDP-glucose/GDP-mannose dehydrogenase family protein [Spirochaetales bacterium]